MMWFQSGSGRSWPIPSISARREPGMARAMARAPDGRISLSALPCKTNAGAVIRLSNGARLPVPMIAANCRENPLG
ncbi:Uncharacterised protein [Mycobacteroides abscessus subsp. abscessus]|nr:Uncharacterised protein [Mycobacteroides abscessus subsp. abscessus]